MKFLCLHGRGTNAQILKTQLGMVLHLKTRDDLLIKKLAPLSYELGRDNISFHFINGLAETDRMTDLPVMFTGPFYRFYAADAYAPDQLTCSLQYSSARDYSPEDTLRAVRQACPDVQSSVEALDFLRQVLNDDLAGPFDGILGFSEGASVAATLLLHQHTKRHDQQIGSSGSSSSSFSPTTPQLKCGVFVSGLPPCSWTDSRTILADESPMRITLPTAHVVGKRDPGKPASKALWNLCEADRRVLVEHSKGHTVPWDKATVLEMARAVREVVEAVKRDNYKLSTTL
ncbi:MAG: hypothetical protein M1827_007520 [Pycnora praestabilis]|nr:MAG: hypothetical protein M1827_007520 [Pycnora praestabilis]